jgi:uncharacterized membrane-anchored protein YjiN (DUF445 family)
MNTVMSLPSLQECQVLMQDIALELSRLEKRLVKIHCPPGAELFADSPLQAELCERLGELRHQHLQPAALRLLGLAQKAAKERLRRAALEGGLP